MADAYLDHGAYASALGTTPTWGVPQEGDGTSKDAATASAIASVLFGSVPTSGTISVCGVSVSVTGVTGAASVDAAANALAANINASSTAVATTVAAGAPQLRNLVFARGPSGGAPAGTCQIMMRVGSTTLNHATNSNVGIATTLTAAPTITQFAGGSGGCWGWLINTAAIGVASTYALGTYGLLMNVPMVVGGGYAWGEYDEVHVRTGLSPNVTIAALTGALQPASTKPGFMNLVFDTNTVWTSDPANGVLTLAYPARTDYSVSFTYGVGAGVKYYTYRCRAKGNFVIALAPPTSGGGNVGACSLEIDGNNAAAGYSYIGVKFIETTNGGGQLGYAFFATSAANGRRSFISCEFDFTASQRVNLVTSLFSVRNGTLFVIDCDIKYVLTGVGNAALTVPLAAPSLATALVHNIVMRGNRVQIGQSAELPIYKVTQGSVGQGSIYTFENNKGLGMQAGALGVMNTTIQANGGVAILDNLGIGGGAHYEDRKGYFQWVLGQPVLSAVSPDGTVWSWLAAWTNTAQAISPGNPLCSPASRLQSRLSTAARTVSVELLVDSVALANLPIYGKLELSYVDAAGDPVLELLPITLAASTASWSNIAGAPYNTWVARKIVVTTKTSVRLNSIINVRLYMDRPVPGGSIASFAMDPEPSLT